MQTVALLSALVACGVAPAQRSGPAFKAQTRALDGDTVSVDFRLLGVDAFERGQLCARDGGCWPCGKAAQDLAAREVRAATAVIALSPTSSYGRPVATVTVGGRDLGERMIASGLAVPAPTYLRNDPARRSRYAAAYLAAERDREGAHAGQWIDPAKWRRGERLTCERPPSKRRSGAARPPR